MIDRKCHLIHSIFINEEVITKQTHKQNKKVFHIDQSKTLLTAADQQYPTNTTININYIDF